MSKFCPIFPECYSDTLFVKLILQRGEPVHCHGISKVVRAIVEYRPNNIIIGLADTDKFKRDKELPQLLRFSEIVENEIDSQGIIICKIPDTNKYLIRIHPEFEKWIWKIVDENSIDPNEYGISSLEKLYRLSKHYKTNQNPQFKQFVNAVVKKNPSPAPIQTLHRWMIKVFAS